MELVKFYSWFHSDHSCGYELFYVFVLHRIEVALYRFVRD
jgi:hypothetical protein